MIVSPNPERIVSSSSTRRRSTPAIIGTRLDVWQVIDTVRNADNLVDAAARYLGLPMTKVRAAVRYYAAYRDEVDAFAARAIAIAERAEAA